MNAMEEVEFYIIPWKSWKLIWLRIDLTAEKMATETETILNPIFIKNVLKKLLVELKYKTKDNLMPN